MSQAKKLWKSLAKKPFGKVVFSQLVCQKAPYFRTIHPRFETLEPGSCTVSMKKRRSVCNHLGTVHAIAMCNMAELAAGTMTDVTVPSSHRWIPKSMSVEYLKKATTDLKATATLTESPKFTQDKEIAVVDVSIASSDQTVVMTAKIDMHISPKTKR
ncbi:MAG: DUF4442 domain-containing protein [Pseudobacteriovorax sp.]|nr:DUF4442 domain-containing protein [Pseudobacteriovorax sp.]